MTFKTTAIILLLTMSLAACASPRKQVAGELRDLGMGKRSANCMAHEMDDRLRKREMKALAKFLDGVDAVSVDRKRRPGKVAALLAAIENPAITRAAAKAGVSCTLLR